MKARIVTAPYSPKARSQVMAMPARIPASAPGIATRQKRESSEWPSVAATSSCPWSTAAKAARAARIKKGAEQKVMAITMP